MITIWKFPIHVLDEQTIDMPAGAEILSAGLDARRRLCVWARVDTDSSGTEPRKIVILGTGNPINFWPMPSLIDRVVVPPFVWHVCEWRASEFAAVPA